MKKRSNRNLAQKYFPYFAVAAAMLPTASIAATTPANLITPFSWAQFKAVYGLPSTPTVPDNSAQIDTTTGISPAASTLVAGQQVRAYRIGNYGTTLPPSGPNNFLDLEAGAGVGDSLVDWAGPFYGSTTASAQDIVVDDDNTNNTVTLNNTVGVAQTSLFGGFAEGGNWSPVPGATAQLDGTSNYYADSYQVIPATDRKTEDDGDNGVSPNYAHWVPYIQTAGFYTAYAFFPSEQLVKSTTPSGVNPEPHVTDARYTIYVQLPGQPLNKYQVTVNQQSGGGWVALGPAHYFPSTVADGQFSSTNPAPSDIGYTGAPTEGLPTNNANAFVDIRLDDTTANGAETKIGSLYYQNYVVADAIKIVGGDGSAFRQYGTPVAVNTTPPILSSQISLSNTTGDLGDYTEIALGYGAGAETGDGKSGGKPAKYQTDLKQTLTAVAGDFFPATTTNGISPQVFSGSIGYDPLLPSTALPIDQVVYFTRTETVLTDPNDASQTAQIGYIYAVNGQNGDVIWRYPNTSPDEIGDTDANQFALNSGTWGLGINTSDSYNNETYDITSAVSSTSGATAQATWTAATLSQGNYFVYAYFPSQGNGENHVASAHYTVKDASGKSYSAYVNQQYGGQWVQLTGTNNTTGAVASTFSLNSSSSVVLTNDTTDFTGSNNGGEVVSADAIEFIPTTSMGTSDSTPAVVRNMKVYDSVSGTYVARTVVIATDNLGKTYCLDAAGNGDGDDTLYDANNLPVYINTQGQGFENYDAASGVLSVTAPTPWHPLNYGTTNIYWIWQPNSQEPISSSDIVDDSDTALTSFTGNWVPSTTFVPGAYLNNIHTDGTKARNGTAALDTFTWLPIISGTNTGAARVYVSVGANDGKVHVNDARYTVIDDTGISYKCQPVDQTVTASGFVQLVSTSGQSVFNFNPSAVTGANTIVLDNSTTDTNSPEVVADAIELVFNGTVDPNSNLIPPLAFQTCSPTVHVVPDTSFTVPSVTNSTTGTTIKYDAYDAKIYEGNSNGVLYALDGAGAPDGSSVYQRDFSQDPTMPSPLVDWWFNAGLKTTDPNGDLEDYSAAVTYSIAGTPAYYHNPNNADNTHDQILFTTFSPQTGTGGGNNLGNLYSVNAIGPVGDYGAGTVPDQISNYASTYPSAAGGVDYNLSPIPEFSFPDAYGTPHLPNSMTPITVPGTDHIITSLIRPLPVSPNIIPPAHPLGDAGGSPVVYGGVTLANPNGGALETLSYRAYFTANDPTTNGDQPSEGRIWGINLTPGSATFGTVDTVSGYASSDGVSSFIYPFPVPPTVPSPPTDSSTYTPVPEGNGGSFDPNLISLTNYNAISNIYDFNNTTGSTTVTGDDQPFGPFTGGPNDVPNSEYGYYVSSSPAVAIVHTIPYTGATGNMLTPTLTNGTNPAGGNYPVEYGSAVGAYDQDIPTLYVGDLAGTLHSINLAGYSDYSRFLQDVLLDGSAIMSTPCVLANGNGTTPFVTSDTGGNNVGGVVFTTTEDGDLYESEALPFIESTQPISIARGTDFEFGGPGGYSSVAASSFNIDNFSFQTPTTATSSDAGVDTSEWVYAGSDAGFTYGFAPSNTALGNGFSSSNSGGFNPGGTISPENNAPENTIPQNRNFITAVLASPPTITAGKLQYSATAGRPPQNGVFDYGQKVYIVVYGLDDPTAGSGSTAATASYPRALTINFRIVPANNTSSNIGRSPNVSVDLQSTGNAYPIQQQTGVWPPPGFNLTSTGTTSASNPSLVGPYGAVYVYQLGTPTTSSLQTPAAKVQLQTLTEQVEYYTSVGANSSLVLRTVQGRSSAGSVVREPNGSGGYVDVQTPAVDQATFSILNPLAVRGFGQTLAAIGSPAQYGYPTLTLVPSNYAGTIKYQLGPFSGADSGNFATFQDADGNSDTVPATEPLGGTITTASGAPIDPNDPSGDQLPRVKTIQMTEVVAPGPIRDGTTGVSSTPTSAGSDPTPSSISSGGTENGPALDTEPPSVGNNGESLLDIADRSALGLINETLHTVELQSHGLQWNDNSGVGGAMAVVNPLPWETMPVVPADVNSTQTNNSRDYPDIPLSNTSIELLPRANAAAGQISVGSDTIMSNTPATLATATPNAGGNDAYRTIYPNAALLRVIVPKFQPANLESYNPASNPGVLEPGNTRLDATVNSVGQGYKESAKVFIAVGSPLAFKPSVAYRTLQVWTSVPVDLATAIEGQSIDVGSVPSGFGLNLTSNGSTPDNSSWSPFQTGTSSASDAFGHFYKPVTILNTGNTNLINLHLNQFNYLNYSNSSLGALVPNPFGSYGASATSIIPSFDLGGLQTGTPLEPIVRSSLDFDLPGTSANTYIENPIEYSGQSSEPVPPGPTAHKPLVGDTTGTVVTTPDVPRNNAPVSVNGQSYFVNLNSEPYAGRPVVSVAVPLGTPVGKYSQTLSAFEGADAASSIFTGPTYGGYLFTRNGWWGSSGTSTSNPNTSAYVNGLQVNSATNTTAQTISNPSVPLTVNVIEDRVTDGTPLPETSAGATSQAVLPQVDYQAITANSNDLQPWAFYAPSTNGSPVIGLLWTSARAGLPSMPFSIYGSTLPLVGTQVAEGTPTFPLVPVSGQLTQWWTPAVPLTEKVPVTAPITEQQSYSASTFTYGGNVYALWVQASVDAVPYYTLELAPVNYTNNVPSFGTPVPLFNSTVPIFSPRASYYITSPGGAAAGFNPTGVGAPASTLGSYPLVVYYTNVAGRSTLMYWPATAVTNGTTTVTSAPVPVPQEVANVSTPTVVARPYISTGAVPGPQVDITYSGQLAPNRYSDIITGRYEVSQTVNGAALLTSAPTLPAVTLATAPAFATTLPTVNEVLTETNGTSAWAARDIGWYRNINAFALYAEISVNGVGEYIPLIPGGSKAAYDRASGQWIFSINWATLATNNTANAQAIDDIATWWTGAATSTAAPNVVVYAKPGNGTISFSTAPPNSNSVISSTNHEQFQTLSVNINPTSLRMTFISQSNNAPISFIDDNYKTNAAPNAGNVVASRYWYIYRKQTSTPTTTSASTSVLYYNTRRLTLVLPNPLQLTDTGTSYTLPTDFDVKDVNGVDVTSQVDVDWSRGRIYFPETYSSGLPSEGQTFTVTYDYTDTTQNPAVTIKNSTLTGVVSWQDEPSFNATSSTSSVGSAAATVGEHELPISTPTNESEPSAFLDPNSGAGGSNLTLNPSSVTPSHLNGQPFPHKVWVFWTSNRNAATNGAGSDIYWETIDPRFEVINP